ncbi:hypothetical protein PR202_gb02365 [Eleusine coracana subsp. coracana]|uniref:Uncharacterized protein n=1 Tax=Eleusine coracana subsp. coracana TaxID=191504 RepID=A0AAV5DWS8_ELECO|nr:hypothetical protein PR202_gb02365 [Eleusine coracana subsp. coracana]
MAGRFLYQKLSSRMSGLLGGARASAFYVAPLTRHRHVLAPSPRCYNTLFITGGTTSRPTTDTLSVTTAKAAFSHSSCPAWEANRAACLAELEAKKATLSEPEYEAEKAAIIDKFAAVKAKVQPLKDALEADHKIWKAKMDK